MWDFIDQELQKQADQKEENPDHSCRPERGQICPRCGRGKLDYNNLLNLSCSSCGYELSASFT